MNGCPAFSERRDQLGTWWVATCWRDFYSSWTSAACQKKKNLYSKIEVPAGYPPTKKIQAWILEDPCWRVNRIRGCRSMQVFPRVYPQVTFMDLHPCQALGSPTGFSILTQVPYVLPVGQEQDRNINSSSTSRVNFHCPRTWPVLWTQEPC